MKELSIEEKAKAYDIALDKIKRLLGTGSSCSREELEYVFPELAESKDERIRKALYLFVEAYGAHANYEVTREEMLAWLEKRGEQKPYGQREECLDCQMNYAGECKGICALKRNKQKPTEWSEEDEDILNTIINHFKIDIECTDEDDTVRWLKSLKDRYTWRPSEMQMTALRRMKNAVGGEGEIYEPLNSLYEDLKKLKD